MISVVKGGEPKALTEARRDIRNTPDAPFDYSSLQGENKRKVLEALVVEQGHLCAYCMCRIGTDNSPATIEHIIPQHPTSLNPDDGLSLSYKNMLAVCDGRNGATCDKRRGNRPLTVNPTKPETLASIIYQRDGTIRSNNLEIDFLKLAIVAFRSHKTLVFYIATQLHLYLSGCHRHMQNIVL